MKPAIKSRFKPLATPLHGAFSCPQTSPFSQLHLNLSHLRLENTFAAAIDAGAAETLEVPGIGEFADKVL